MAETQIEFSKTLQDQLIGFWHMNEYCDVKVICRAGKEFHCHRLVLVTASKYFEEHLRRADNVMVEEYPVSVIEEILNFIYTDNIEFTESEIRNILMAAEFFKLRHLNLMDEIAVRFILGLQEPVSDMIILFSYIMQTSPGRRTLAQGLATHIMKFFGKFAEKDIIKFEVTWWLTLLNQRWYLPRGKEIAFLDLFNRSLCPSSRTPNGGQTNEERIYLTQEDISFLVFDYHGDDYRLWLTSQFAQPPHPLRSQDCDWIDRLEPKTLPTLHVFVREALSRKTHVFSASREFPTEWKISYDVPEYLKSMKLVAVGENLYCLGYSLNTLKFHELNSVKYPEIQNLMPPPAMHASVDMCSTREHIFMITYGQLASESRKIPHSIKVNQAEMYKYDIETDTWAPIELPPIGCCKAATITVYDYRVFLFAKASNVGSHAVLYELVYGGYDDDSDNEDYDDESYRWVNLGSSNMKHYEEKMTCCAFDDKLYLCSSREDRAPVMEGYNLRTHLWEEVAPVPREFNYVHQLLPFENWIWAIGKLAGHDACTLRIYNTYSDAWEPAPLTGIQELIRSDSPIHFLDSVVFKPTDEEE